MTSLLSSSFLLEIQKEPFGNEKIVYNNQEKLPNLFHIRHKFKGWNVSFTDFGAIIQKIQIENKNNKLIDIVLGHDSPKEYILYGGYFGSIVGRVCNRYYYLIIN
jgi:galactose mutarotase-like enzyme